MLPSKLLYKNKVDASYARNFTSVINPQNQNTANVGNTSIINIPCVNNQFLSGADSLLSFTLNVDAGTTSTTCRLNKCGVAGLIQRLRIFHGSTLLQDIDNYAQLVSMLVPFQMSSDDVEGKSNLLMGTDKGRGMVLGAGNGVITAGTAVSKSFAFPLMSILSLTENYVPCWALTSAPLRLEIQWVSAVNKAINCNTAIIKGGDNLITDLKFLANFVEVNDSAMEMVKKALGGSAVEWVCQSFSNYQYNTTLGTSTTQVSMPVPAKYNSLKALYATFREKSSGSAGQYADDSPNFRLSEYSTRIGSLVIPSEKPTTVPQFLGELHRALGSISDNQQPCSYSTAQYESDDTAAGIAMSSAFAVGVETESYSSAPMNSTYQGLNTATSDIFFQPVFAAQDNNANILIDVFASYDQLVTIENGMAMVQF